MDVRQLIIAYLVGGVTFIPLLVISFFLLHPKKDLLEEDEEPLLKAGEVEEEKHSGLETYKSGWITVTHEYLESTDDLGNMTQSISDNAEVKSAYSTLYKIAQKDVSVDGTEIVDTTPTQTSERAKGAQKRHRFYAILKHGNLFLYKDETLKDVKHVIVLTDHFITMWPRDVIDGQIFAKMTAICIMKRDWSRSRRLSESLDKDKITTQDILDPQNNLKPPKGSVYIYLDLNTEKEDWYFSLIKSTKIDDTPHPLNPKIYAKTLHFETKNMIDLIQTLYSSEGQLETKWFNALIGRLFLSLRKTEFLNNYMKKRIYKKLNKIKKPEFLDRFQIEKLDTGNTAPFLTYPSLKEISPDGTLLMSGYIHYHGSLSLHVSTRANINLGSRFKPRFVDLVLRITLEKLQGPILIKIKPPPTSRLWYTFEIEPIMNLNIEPIISSRQFTYTIITNQIMKKIKESIRESLVLPHWDDISFYDTDDEIYRGGIWDKDVRTSSYSEGDDIYDNGEDESISVKNDIESKSELSSIRSNMSKLKNSSTLNNLSKKIKKTKSTHTLGISEENCLSDGSLLDGTSKVDRESLSSDSSIGKKPSLNTFKRIGKWYFKEDKGPNVEDYTPPEMISNRRGPRKSVSEQIRGTQTSMHKSTPSYDFANFDENISIMTELDSPRIVTPHDFRTDEKPPLPPRDNVSTSIHSFDESSSRDMANDIDTEEKLSPVHSDFGERLKNELQINESDFKEDHISQPDSM